MTDVPASYKDYKKFCKGYVNRDGSLRERPPSQKASNYELLCTALTRTKTCSIIGVERTFNKETIKIYKLATNRGVIFIPTSYIKIYKDDTLKKFTIDKNGFTGVVSRNIKKGYLLANMMDKIYKKHKLDVPSKLHHYITGILLGFNKTDVKAYIINIYFATYLTKKKYTLEQIDNLYYGNKSLFKKERKKYKQTKQYLEAKRIIDKIAIDGDKWIKKNLESQKLKDYMKNKKCMKLTDLVYQ